MNLIYRILTLLLRPITDFLCRLNGTDPEELRRRIRWHRQAGIPFDPKNFR